MPILPAECFVHADMGTFCNVHGGSQLTLETAQQVSYTFLLSVTYMQVHHAGIVSGN